MAHSSQTLPILTYPLQNTLEKPLTCILYHLLCFGIILCNIDLLKSRTSLYQNLKDILCDSRLIIGQIEDFKQMAIFRQECHRVICDSSNTQVKALQLWRGSSQT